MSSEPFVETDAIEKLVRYRDKCKSEVSWLSKQTALSSLGLIVCQVIPAHDFATLMQLVICFAFMFVVYTVTELLLLTRRLKKYKRLVSIADSGERREMLITSCVKFGWIHVTTPNTTERATLLRLDPKIENGTLEELRVQFMNDVGSFPLNCVALIDKTTNQPALIYVRNVLLGVKEIPKDDKLGLALRRGQATFKAESVMRVNTADARSKIDDRTPEDRREHLEQMIRDLLALQKQVIRMVTLGYACLLFLSLAIFALCFFLFKEFFLGFIWLISVPFGLLIVFSFLVPLFCRWTVKQVEDSVAIVRTAVPVDIQITKIEGTGNKYGDYWIEFQQSKLTDPPKKRVRVGSFDLALGDFWYGLYNGFTAHGTKPDGPFPLPATLFMDPSGHEPVAVAVDDVLTCVDRKSYAATDGDNNKSLTEESN